MCCRPDAGWAWFDQLGGHPLVVEADDELVDRPKLTGPAPASTFPGFRTRPAEPRWLGGDGRNVRNLMIPARFVRYRTTRTGGV